METLRRTLLAPVLALCVWSCSEVVPPSTLADELAALRLDVELAAPVRLNADMVRWARAAVPAAVGREERSALLLEALLTRSESPFRYRSGVTTSVREAWETGSANCLTFTHLFVGMAREVGVDAYYLRVREVVSFEREGDLVVTSDHVTAAIDSGVRRKIVDFSSRPIRRYVEVETIDDRRALALHYSNLGAEAIRSGEIAEGVARLETATSIDPGLADGWVNLGVARRRSGDLAGAEAAYRRALAVDVGQVSAYHNLVALLEWLGRDAEAKALLSKLSPADLRNPWTGLALGRLALREGELHAARRLLGRARRLLPDNADVWAALGEWALAAERPREARRHLEHALRLDPGNAAAARFLAGLSPRI